MLGVVHVQLSIVLHIQFQLTTYVFFPTFYPYILTLGYGEKESGCDGSITMMHCVCSRLNMLEDDTYEQ